MTIAKKRQRLKKAIESHKELLKIKELNKQPKNKKPTFAKILKS